MNFQTHKWRLSRRHVLRGLGVSLSLPMLECMAADKKKPPKRSIFIYLPNGVNTLDYQILQSGKGYGFSKCLRPLEKHRDVITPISGLHHPRSIGYHHGCQQVWLTGAQAGSNERNSISVDQLMAQTTAPHTRFSSLILSNTGRSLSYNADGIGIPAETKPAQVFKRLFTAPEGGVGKERQELRRTGSVLDVVLDEAKALKREVGTEDRTRLDQYLDSVREVEIRTQRADAWLDVPRPVIRPEQERRVNKDVSLQKVGEYFRAMYDLIVLAFETDLTRVATFSTGDEGKGLAIPEININQTRHSLSHHNGDPEQLRRLTESDAFNFQQFAYLLDRLQTTKDTEGKPLLDTTMCLYGSGMAYGHSHGNANVPTVLAGGAGLGLSHGNHLDFNTGHFDGYDLGNAKKHYQLCSRPLNPDARLSNLLLTMAQKMDVETESFSDSLTTIGGITA